MKNISLKVNMLPVTQLSKLELRVSVDMTDSGLSDPDSKSTVG